MAKKKEDLGLEETIGLINKRYGDGTIVRASESPRLKLKRIPFGIPVLDLALDGGIPRGRIILIRGPYSSGKSLLAYQIASEVQKRCRVCGKQYDRCDVFTGEVLESLCTCMEPTPSEVVWADAEHVFNDDWAKRRGVLLKHCYVIQPEYGEQTIDVTDIVIRSRKSDLIVIDSIAAMAPSVEVEKSSEETNVAPQARLMNKAFRKFGSALNSGSMAEDNMPTIILINQTRKIIGPFGGETMPGGGGQKYHSSMILGLSVAGLIKYGSEESAKPIGHNIGVKVVKSNNSRPRRSCMFPYFYDTIPKLGLKAGTIGFWHQILALGESIGKVQKKGSWFSIADGPNLGQGEHKAAIGLSENPEIAREIWEESCAETWGKVD